MGIAPTSPLRLKLNRTPDNAIADASRRHVGVGRRLNCYSKIRGASCDDMFADLASRIVSARGRTVYTGHMCWSLAIVV